MWLLKIDFIKIVYICIKKCKNISDIFVILFWWWRVIESLIIIIFVFLEYFLVVRFLVIRRLISRCELSSIGYEEEERDKVILEEEIEFREKIRDMYKAL